jgi:multiple sugar transport system substrate-binding protein
MSRKAWTTLLAVVAFTALVLVVAQASAKTKLVMLHWEGPDTPLQQGVELFQQLNPDIEVELMSASAYTDKIFTMHAGGVDFDLLYVSADVYVDWVNKGLLKDITAFLEKDPQLGKKDFFLPIETDRCAVNGRWYGIGSSWSLFQVYYNRDAFDASGLEPMPRTAEKAWSWDQYIKTAQKLTRISGQTVERYGAGRPTWWLVVQSFLLSNGGNILNPEGTQFLLDQPVSIAVHEAINVGINEMGVFGGSFSKGENVMHIAGSWSTGLGYGASQLNFSVDEGVLPKFITPATYAQGHIHSMHSNTKHPEEAWRLLRFFSSNDYLGMWVKNGVWLPTTREMMRPDAFVKYHNPSFMPEGYLEYVMTYLYEVGRARKMPVGWGDALKVYEQGIAQVWSGERPVRTVLSEVTPQMNAILKEQQAR